MEGHEAFLDVRAGAHLLGAAEEHADGAAPDPLEERLLLGVGVGVADGGDLRAGDAACDELVDDLLVDRVAPGRGVHPHVAEDHLRAAGGCRALPDGGDLLHQGVQLRAGVVRGGPGEHPGVEGELSAVGRDGERVVVAGVHLLRAQALVAGHELTLERCLLVRHRAGDDDGLAALEARAGEV